MNRLLRCNDTLSVPMLAGFARLMLGAPFVPDRIWWKKAGCGSTVP